MLFRSWWMDGNGHLQVPMVLMWIGTGEVCGRSWRVYIPYGMCRGAWGVILTLSGSLVSVQGRHSIAMEELNEFIFDLDFMDLPLVGGEFTWSNGRVWSRLDRFLVSPLWEAKYPEVNQRRLAQVNSDHYPILLDCGGIHRWRRYFKFENMWLIADGFVERVRAWWTTYQFMGTPSYILASKLKVLKQDLKK